MQKIFSYSLATIILLLGTIFLGVFSVFAEDPTNFSVGLEISDHKISDTLVATTAPTEKSKSPVDVKYRATQRTANMGDYGNFSPVQSVGALGSKILSFLMSLLGVIGLLGIMIGGGMMMFGGVDDAMLERGKEIILYSLIGVGIALLAMAITTLVQTIFYSVDI